MDADGRGPDQPGRPVVIAMAGSVTDQACRLFTRTFGTALARGGCAAQGCGRRQAGRIPPRRRPPSKSIDWALPCLFLSESIRMTTTRSPRPRVPPYRNGFPGYGFPEGPVFCARSIFSAFTTS